MGEVSQCKVWIISEKQPFWNSAALVHIKVSEQGWWQLPLPRSLFSCLPKKRRQTRPNTWPQNISEAHPIHICGTSTLSAGLHSKAVWSTRSCVARNTLRVDEKAVLYFSSVWPRPALPASPKLSENPQQPSPGQGSLIQRPSDCYRIFPGCCSLW